MIKNKYHMFPQTATSGPMAKLGDFLRAHHENLFLNDDNIGDKVSNQLIAYPLVIKRQSRYFSFPC